MRFRKYTVILCLIVLSIFSFTFVEFCRPKSSSEALPAEGNEYVGDSQCQNCHRQEFDEWKGSDHYKAMLPASDSTVLGDFNNTSFTADGITSRFFKRDG